MSFLCKIRFVRQCKWDTSCRSRRELSSAIVTNDFRLTGVEIWPFGFGKGSYNMGNLQGKAGGTREKGHQLGRGNLGLKLH